MDQQLLVFVTVAELKSFSQAAKDMHMTQPAVSQYIKSLERTMGVKLLERTNKYVRLNKAGEIVYHHAKEIVGLYTKMGDLVDDLTNKTSGPLSIGASYSFGEYVLPHLIAKMQTSYPLIHPTVSIGNTKEIAELVLGHQLDIGIIEGPFHDRNLIIEPFATDTMRIVVSNHHSLAKRNDELTLSELEQETWIIRESGSGTREAAENVFKQFEKPPKNVLEFGSTQLIKGSVEAGVGISLLSDWVIHEECTTGKLKILKVKDVDVTRVFSTVLRSSFQTKALEVFIKMLTEMYGTSIKMSN